MQHQQALPQLCLSCAKNSASVPVKILFYEIVIIKMVLQGKPCTKMIDSILLHKQYTIIQEVHP